MQGRTIDSRDLGWCCPCWSSPSPSAGAQAAGSRQIRPFPSSQGGGGLPSSSRTSRQGPLRVASMSAARYIHPDDPQSDRLMVTW